MSQLDLKPVDEDGINEDQDGLDMVNTMVILSAL